MTEEPLSLFASNRERRLWIATLAVVFAIYSTLGLVPALTGALRARGLLGIVFSVSALMIGIAVFTQGLKTRPRGIEIGVALGVVAVYLLVLVRVAIPEERTHLVEYGVVAVLIHEALIERKDRGRRVPLPYLIAFLATSMLGMIDECIQAILPSRVFAPRDILFNVLAGGMAVAALLVLGWARRWTARRRNR